MKVCLHRPTSQRCEIYTYCYRPEALSEIEMYFCCSSRSFWTNVLLSAFAVHTDHRLGQQRTHLRRELSVGQNAVLIGEGVAEIIKRRHAVSARKTKKSTVVSFQPVISIIKQFDTAVTLKIDFLLTLVGLLGSCLTASNRPLCNTYP